ncbi:hypothetical protein WCX49_01660 [Sulfurimonas sp. HSL-1656]|uniref:hypothetical protein n=1 Tax=Thiomicrolovo subterrani TaxID=3131934 RepID=UPI0031F80783
MNKIRCYQLIGAIFASINFLLFMMFYRVASGMDAQYQLAWLPLSFIDFPITTFYFLFIFLGLSPNAAAFITFGILGTSWWYFLSSYIAKKFNKCRRALNP